MDIDPKYHPKIIGRKGLVIKKIREEHGVRIQFPERGDDNQSQILIHGYEQSAQDAKEEILKLVQEYVRLPL